jgi:hypothetical protein
MNTTAKRVLTAGRSAPPPPTSVAELRERLNATFPRSDGQRVCVEYQDEGPDALGRRHFALMWIQDDGKPHARIRGQHFFAVPDRCVIEDATVTT